MYPEFLLEEPKLAEFSAKLASFVLKKTTPRKWLRFAIRESVNTLHNVKFVYNQDASVYGVSASGIYDQENDIICICLSSDIGIDESFRIEAPDTLGFLLYNKICHEHIHRCQYRRSKIKHTVSGTGQYQDAIEQMDISLYEYLNDPTEIDAWGHSVASDIVFTFGMKKSGKVLQCLSNYMHRLNDDPNIYSELDKQDIRHYILWKKLYASVIRWMPFVRLSRFYNRCNDG